MKILTAWDKAALVVIVFAIGFIGSALYFSKQIAESEIHSAQEHTEEDYKIKIEKEKSFDALLKSDPVAYYTKWLFYATATLAVFTAALAVVTVAIWVDGKETARKQQNAARRTLRHTARSADASVKAAEATALIANSDRAWIVFEHFDIADIHNTRIDDIFYSRTTSFSPVFSNKGRSPALEVQVTSHIKIVKIDDFVTPEFVATFHGDKEGAGIVGGNSPFNGRPIVLKEEDFAEYIKTKVAVIAYCCARYKIISDPSIYRQTQVCYRIHWPGMVTERDGTQRPHWQIESVGNQNTMT